MTSVMEKTSNTILITGGASGIGLALASRLLAAGNTVIICGRRENKLQEAKNLYPNIHTHVCDISRESGRIELFTWVSENFPQLNVLINNAGIQRRVQLTQQEDWKLTAYEIAVNLEAPIHLSTLFTRHLMKQSQSAIINITSGLAFSPLASVPVYCATKAALHSFTLSLRFQLANTPVSVIEIIPPAVNTDLGGPGLHTFGTPLDEFADEVVKRLLAGRIEIAYGFAEKTSQASRAELDAAFLRMNQDH